MSTARVIFALGGTTAYLGLAALGWGGMSAFFSHPALVALTVAIFATAVASLFVGGNMSPGIREDRGNRWVIVAFALVGAIAAFVRAWTGLLPVVSFPRIAVEPD